MVKVGAGDLGGGGGGVDVAVPPVPTILSSVLLDWKIPWLGSELLNNPTDSLLFAAEVSILVSP